MENSEASKSAIHEIGSEMVACGRQCAGVGNDKNEGILPRCLYFEDGNDLQGTGSVIVGLNPGNSFHSEQQFYVAQGATYDSQLAFWDQKIKNIRYYVRLRRLVRELGFEGPILWTELVKCENKVKKEVPPLQTFRTCTKSYLKRELEMVPDDWPLIAVSKYVFRALAFLYPSRVVLGVPHPTGGFGNCFGKLLASCKPQWDDLWNEDGGKALWLDAAT